MVLHYVNKKGQVIECFPGLVHVPNTDVLSLKLALESLFAKYGLSLSRLRRQGYDGASNMQGEFNGFKSLILKENLFYILYSLFCPSTSMSSCYIGKKTCSNCINCYSI